MNMPKNQAQINKYNIHINIKIVEYKLKLDDKVIFNNKSA